MLIRQRPSPFLGRGTPGLKEKKKRLAAARVGKKEKFGLRRKTIPAKLTTTARSRPLSRQRGVDIAKREKKGTGGDAIQKREKKDRGVKRLSLGGKKSQRWGGGA